jgi:AbrB family looped-hinge helix DNA binding protein
MAGVPSDRVQGPQTFKVSSSGQLSLPAPARRRWGLDAGGQVEVLDLDFGVLVLPPGGSAELRRSLLDPDARYRAVAELDDPDLRTT